MSKKVFAHCKPQLKHIRIETRLRGTGLSRTAMNAKIIELQQAEKTAFEQATKLLPRDLGVPPESLRCEYPPLRAMSTHANQHVRLCALVRTCCVRVMCASFIAFFVACYYLAPSQVLGRHPPGRLCPRHAHRPHEKEHSCIPVDILRHRYRGRAAGVSEVRQRQIAGRAITQRVEACFSSFETPPDRFTFSSEGYR